MNVAEITDRHAWTGSRYIDVLAPKTEDFDIWEIAVGLSRESRYGANATKCFWSVGQHSLLVLHLLRESGIYDRETARCGIMHDAPEYMLRDIIRPVKSQLPEYRSLEDVWWTKMAARWGLPVKMPRIIKEFDMKAMAIEKHCLIAKKAGSWPGVDSAPDQTIPRHILALTMDECARMFSHECQGLQIT